MKSLMALAFIASIGLTACGSENAPSNEGHDHGHEHSHSGGHVLGQFKLDDGYYMQASHTGAIKPGATVQFELVFKHNDEPVKDAKMSIYAGPQDGAPAGKSVTASWDDHAGHYKAALQLPEELPHGTHIHFEANHNGASFHKSVSVMGHDHS